MFFFPPGTWVITLIKQNYYTRHKTNLPTQKYVETKTKRTLIASLYLKYINPYKLKFNFVQDSAQDIAHITPTNLWLKACFPLKQLSGTAAYHG